jgi:N-acetylglucosaminyldiphosphoundecaprenol N-acetyl-beta-D-mannosaminyltransferase
MNVQTNKSIRLLGICIDSVTTNELLNKIYLLTKTNTKAIVANSNIHALNIAYRDRLFRSFIQSSAINFCDGAGVIIGAMLINKKIVERITYADFMWQLAAFASKKGLSMFFVGASPGVAERAGEKICETYPTLRIVGIQHGFFCKDLTHFENKHVIAKINLAKPDLLIVGMGMPLQEHWIMNNFDNLDVKVIFNGGAVFDYISGKLRRPPPWMTSYGMEWLGRLMIEPRRLWKRYLIGNPLFFWRVFLHHILGFPLPY